MHQSDAIQRRSNTMMPQSHENSKTKSITSQAMRYFRPAKKLQHAPNSLSSHPWMASEAYISHVLALEWSLHPKMLFSVCVPPVAASLCSKQNACSEMETNFLFLQFPLQHLQKSQTAIILRLYSFLFHIKFTSM